MALLEFTPDGIYCPQADVYLDPWKPVRKALITHGHADHARWGHQHYLCTTAAAPVIRHRLNLNDNLETIPFNQKLVINGVTFSFHPAGHIPGSAQIRVEYLGEVWVFSGDYKLQHDGISEPFEPVRCHTFITESTFGLPVYAWKPQAEIFEEINEWWRRNQSEGKVSVIAGYALGKSQRILKNVDATIGKIFVHGAINSITSLFRNNHMELPLTTYVSPEMKKKDFEGALVVCPPSALGTPWLRKFDPYSLGIASGWMGLRGARRRRGADRGFVLSDHADWVALNQAVVATGAQRVFVTHGYSEIFSRWLNSLGLEAGEVKTQYEGELAEIAESGIEEAKVEGE
jgi:putative mRNA 3-end processing factor